MFVFSHVENAESGQVATEVQKGYPSPVRSEGRKDWNWEHASKWWASVTGATASRHEVLEGTLVSQHSPGTGF